MGQYQIGLIAHGEEIFAWHDGKTAAIQSLNYDGKIVIPTELFAKEC
jgi:hypothetical protein